MKEEQPYERAVIKSKRKIFLNNFIGGIGWALGVTIGFSLLIAMLGILSDYIGLVPFIGSFISDIIDFVLSYNKNLK